MLDILLLIFLSIRIKNIVKPKGYNTTTWVMRTVVFWIGAELAGMAISYMIQGDLFTCLVSGLLCAIASYFYIQNKARSLPDLNQTKDWRDNFYQD
jgi:1,4-dihydroxy-2-naphthoate octaprenyltransferase